MITKQQIIDKYRNCVFCDNKRASLASMGNIIELCNIGTDFAVNNQFGDAVNCWTYIVNNYNEVPDEVYVNLGVSYYYGHAVTQNFEKAVGYYQIAANNGNPMGQYNLAVAYENGKGVQKNIDMAISLFEKAAEKSVNAAIDALIRLGVYNELGLAYYPRSFDDNTIVKDYSTLLSNKLREEQLSFNVIREVSKDLYYQFPKKIQDQLREDAQRGISPLNSEPHLCVYMFAYGKMHNAKLRRAYDNISPEFRQQETIDIVDYACGQAMGCICYADFLRENGIGQRVRRVVLIEPSKVALERAALHVSKLFPDAAIKKVCKGFDDLQADDLCYNIDVPTLHILSNILDMGDKLYNLDRFADLVSGALKGNNEFVCVEPLFSHEDDLKPARFFERLKIKPYYQLQRGRGEFVIGETWTCAIYCGCKNVKSSINNYKDCIAMANNKAAQAVANCGTVLGETCKNEAIMYYLKAISYQETSTAYYNLANLCKDCNEYDDAIHFYEKSIHIESTYESFNNMGYCYYQMEDDVKALECFQKSYAIAPSSMALRNMGNCYKNMGESKLAEECYDSADNLDGAYGVVIY